MAAHHVYSIPPEARYFIVASDGFWDVFISKGTDQTHCGPTGIHFLKTSFREDILHELSSRLNDAKNAQQNLGQVAAQWARDRGSRDDISVLVYSFNEPLSVTAGDASV